MTRAEQIAAVLAEHESLLGSDDYTSCVCGADTVDLGGLRGHVAAALDVALAAQDGERPIHAAQDGDLDRPACELIAATAGCDGINAVATWHALQPFIGHLIREAPEGERGGAKVAAAVEALLTDEALDALDARLSADVYDRLQAIVENPNLTDDDVARTRRDDMRSALRAALADPAGALAKHDAEVLDGLEQRLSAAYDENPWGKFRSGLGRAIRILRVYRADRIEGQPSTEGEPS